MQEAFKGLTAWWKGLLGAEAEQVKLSTRLATSPCIVSTSKYGYSANMERIMRAQVRTPNVPDSSRHACALLDHLQACSSPSRPESRFA